VLLPGDNPAKNNVIKFNVVRNNSPFNLIDHSGSTTTLPGQHLRDLAAEGPVRQLKRVRSTGGVVTPGRDSGSNGVSGLTPLSVLLGEEGGP